MNGWMPTKSDCDPFSSAYGVYRQAKTSPYRRTAQRSIDSGKRYRTYKSPCRVSVQAIWSCARPVGAGSTALGALFWPAYGEKSRGRWAKKEGCRCNELGSRRTVARTAPGDESPFRRCAGRRHPAKGLPAQYRRSPFVTTGKYAISYQHLEKQMRNHSVPVPSGL